MEILCTDLLCSGLYALKENHAQRYNELIIRYYHIFLKRKNKFQFLNTKIHVNNQQKGKKMGHQYNFACLNLCDIFI